MNGVYLSIASMVPSNFFPLFQTSNNFPQWKKACLYFSVEYGFCGLGYIIFVRTRVLNCVWMFEFQTEFVYDMLVAAAVVVRCFFT